MIKRLCAMVSFLMIYPICANESCDPSEIRQAQIDEILRGCAEIKKDCAELREKFEKAREDFNKPIVLESDSYGFVEKIVKITFTKECAIAVGFSVGIACIRNFIKSL